MVWFTNARDFSSRATRSSSALCWRRESSCSTRRHQSPRSMGRRVSCIECSLTRQSESKTLLRWTSRQKLTNKSKRRLSHGSQSELASKSLNLRPWPVKNGTKRSVILILRSIDLNIITCLGFWGFGAG